MSNYINTKPYLGLSFKPIGSIPQIGAHKRSEGPVHKGPRGAHKGPQRPRRARPTRAQPKWEAHKGLAHKGPGGATRAPGGPQVPSPQGPKGGTTRARL